MALESLAKKSRLLILKVVASNSKILESYALGLYNLKPYTKV